MNGQAQCTIAGDRASRLVSAGHDAAPFFDQPASVLGEHASDRIFLYTTLTLAIVTAMWFSGARVRPLTRLGMATAVVLALVPPRFSMWLGF